MTEKFNVGDIVTIRKDLKVGKHYGLVREGHVATDMIKYAGKKAKIKVIKPSSSVSNGLGAELDIDKGSWFWFFEGESVFTTNGKGRPVKEKPDDLVRYMVYGTGCDNKSKLFESEKELKDEVKKVTQDSAWTGRIIGYKLTPLFEGEKKTVIKAFKQSKVKKKK